MIYLASQNAHKALELGRLLGSDVAPLPGYDAPVEDGETFTANARIKARAGAAVAPAGAMTVADDSGIVVEALGGAPGIHSARYGGDGLDDAGRVTHLLHELGDATDRRAAFVCVLVAIAADGSEVVAEGRVDGTIAAAPRGHERLRLRPDLRAGRRDPHHRRAVGCREGRAVAPGTRSGGTARRAGPVTADARGRAAALATATSAILIAVKVALALVTGSVAVLAEATHAAAELLRTIVAAFAARDEGRPGGTPASAGRLEGGIVVVAGVVAAFASLRTLGGDVDVPLVGIAGLLACALLARLVAARVSRVAAATGSAALAADARSLRSSQATAVLAAGALAIVVLADATFPDAVGGLLISGVVVRIGVELIQAARPGRERVGAAELAAISDELAAGPPEVVGYGKIVGRTAAGVRRIDIDVTLQAGVTPQRDDGDRRRPARYHRTSCPRLPHRPAPT